MSLTLDGRICPVMNEMYGTEKVEMMRVWIESVMREVVWILWWGGGLSHFISRSFTIHPHEKHKIAFQ